MGKRIVVVGAGAVGGYVGAQLAAAGQDVTLVDGWDEHVATRAQARLRDRRNDARRRACLVPVAILHEREIERLAEGPPVDMALIAVKSYDTQRAVTMILPFLADGCARGFVAERNQRGNHRRDRRAGADRWDHRRAHRGRAGSARACAAHGAARQPGYRRVPGRARSTGGARYGSRSLAPCSASSNSVKVTSNLAGERWSKLSANAMRNGVSAATGLSINQLDRDPGLRRFGIKVAGEAIRVGQRLGYELENIGTVAARDFALAEQGDAEVLAQGGGNPAAAAEATTTRSDAQRPSMGQDVNKGRRTEVEEIYGVVIARANEVGLPVPANERGPAGGPRDRARRDHATTGEYLAPSSSGRELNCALSLRTSPADPRSWRRSPSIGAATAHEAMGRRGALDSAIKPILRGSRRGRSGVPVRRSSRRQPHLARGPGPGPTRRRAGLLGRGFADGASFGDVMAEAARIKGSPASCWMVRPATATCCARSGCRSIARGLSLKSRGDKAFLGPIAVPVVAGGIRIDPGDLVIGDDDGVVAVPLQELDAVAAVAHEREVKEAEAAPAAGRR